MTQSPTDSDVQASSRGASEQCATTRVPVSEAARTEILHRFAWMQSEYPLEGRWTPAGDTTDTGPAFAGALEVEFGDEPPAILPQCFGELEIPVRVTLRVDDVLIAERVDGSVRVQGRFDEATGFAPGEVRPRQTANLRAEFDPTPLADGVRGSITSGFGPGRARLETTLTPFGTRGGLQVQPASAPRSADPNTLPAAPPLLSILSWPEADHCGVYGPAMTPPPEASVVTLESELELINRTYLGSYPDGEQIDVSFELHRPTDICGSAGLTHMLTEVDIRTSEDGWSLKLPVLMLRFVDDTLGFRTRLEDVWVYTSEAFAQRFGTLDLDLSMQSFVGVYVDFSSATHSGGLKVVGFQPGDCSRCDVDSCTGCSMNRGVPLLDLTLAEPH